MIAAGSVAGSMRDARRSFLEAQQVADAAAADPGAVDAYGLPLAVQDYGAFVAVRLQRATLQLWPTGSVTVGNGGDMAKDAGLWPATVTLPAVVMQP